MIDAAAWPAWVVLLPLTGAVLAALSARHAAGVAYLFAGATLVACVGLVHAVWHTGPLQHAAGGWIAPLGIELHADGVAALAVAVTALVGVVIVVFASGYFVADPHAEAGAPASERAARFFWPLWLFVWAALNGVFLSADVFNLYISLELLGIAAVALVALEGTTAASTAAMRYLIISLLGSLLFLLGVALLYAAAGTLSLAELAARPPAGAAGAAALAAMTVGLAMKTALFPFHAWLPPAHASAPAPASAALSALVVKASFFILLRLWLGVFGAAAHGPAAPLLGALGAGAVLWGSLLALRQRRLKLLIAYSTVAQLGYLFLLFPLWRDTPAGALTGGVYQFMAHSFAKAAWFLAAGAMVRAFGDDGFDTLAGAGSRLPIAFAAFGIAGISLAGLPPSGGFIAKWLLLTAAIGSGQWFWAIVIIAGSVLAAGYVFIVLRAAFLREPATELLQRPPLRLELAALGLALGALALGVWGNEPIRLLLEHSRLIF